jgi:hypothetical protein
MTASLKEDQGDMGARAAIGANYGTQHGFGKSFSCHRPNCSDLDLGVIS